MASIKGGDKLEKILKEMAAKLGSGSAVRVGFLEGSTYPDGTPTAMVAAIQEWGAPGRKIPPRPFFRTMVAEKSPGWPKAIADLLAANGYDAKKTLAQVGEGVAGQLRTNRWNSSAIGRYQVVRTTLRDQRAKLGLKGSDLYDEKTQDLIGANLARQTRGNAVALKNEWASLVGAKNAIAVELMRKVDPKSSVMPLDRPPANTEGARKPDVLADPGDDRRKPLASVLYPAVPKAAQTGAASVVAQTASIAPDRAAVTTNDNRSTSTSTAEAHFHGDMVFNGVKDSGDVERNLRARLKEPQFIQAANYAQA